MEDFDIAKYLSEHDIKVSFQRMKIFEYFVKFRGHPTVNDIYDYVIKEIPTLSKTTVYNTLSLFVEKNVLVLVTIEENETRYDWAPNIHGHFKCEKCGEVIDVNFKEDSLKEVIPELKDFNITHHHVNFNGICSKCK